MPPAVLDEEAAARHPILYDAGVLLDDGARICELGDWSGGQLQCVLPWRATALSARQAGAAVAADAGELSAGSFAQCVVHLDKSRPATMRAVDDALSLLCDDGELLVIGYNDLGIKSVVGKLEQRLGAKASVRTNRKRGRVVAFARAEVSVPDRTPDERFDVDEPVALSLRAEPGVFSRGKLDPGSELLLSHLPAQRAPARVLDLGCGAGPLGLSAAALWGGCRVTMLDADARAVRSARSNAQRLGMGARVTTAWWDAREGLPEGLVGATDLVLSNPPFHTGKGVDLGPAVAMFDRAAAALSPEGAALIVANRTLPYEPQLKGLGTLETIVQARGFKLLRLTRPR